MKDVEHNAANDINTGHSVLPKEISQNFEDEQNLENNNGNVRDVNL